MKTETDVILGPVGNIEFSFRPLAHAHGVAFISHPHPLFGGTMEHKVVHTLQRAFGKAGWSTLRYNFRGVGHSAGEHAHGVGERDDLHFLVQHFAPPAPGGKLAFAGFSFGCYVTSLVVQSLNTTRDVAHLVYVGPATSRWPMLAVPQGLHERTLVVHGENDEIVPFETCMQWARPQNLPVTVVPQGGHFFHGQQSIVFRLVQQFLSRS